MVAIELPDEMEPRRNALRLLHVTLQFYVSHFGADGELWIEGSWVNGSRYPRSGLMMARTASTVESIALRAGLNPHFVHPLTWRKGVYGNGRPANPKTAALKFVKETLHYDLPVMGSSGRGSKLDHNYAEAIAIACYGGMQT